MEKEVEVKTLKLAEQEREIKDKETKFLDLYMENSS